MAMNYAEFLIDEDPVEITAGEGKVKAKLHRKIIFEENYVVGDYDDKLSTTLRAYKKTIEAMLEERAHAK